MDKRNALTIAQNYIELIGKNFSIEGAFLFGSSAKGTNNSSSDIDIAIVINDIPDIIDFQIELMKLRREIDLRIEPHPFRKKDFNNHSLLVNEILLNGIELKINEAVV